MSINGAPASHPILEWLDTPNAIVRATRLAMSTGTSPQELVAACRTIVAESDVEPWDLPEFAEPFTVLLGDGMKQAALQRQVLGLGESHALDEAWRELAAQWTDEVRFAGIPDGNE